MLTLQLAQALGRKPKYINSKILPICGLIALTQQAMAKRGDVQSLSVSLRSLCDQPRIVASTGFPSRPDTPAIHVSLRLCDTSMRSELPKFKNQDHFIDAPLCAEQNQLICERWAGFKERMGCSAYMRPNPMPTPAELQSIVCCTPAELLGACKQLPRFRKNSPKALQRNLLSRIIETSKEFGLPQPNI